MSEARWRVTIVQKTGNQHLLPVLTDKQEARDTARVAQQFSWAYRVIVSEGTSSYSDDFRVVADLPGAVIAGAPEAF